MINVGMDVHVRNSFFHATDATGHVLKKGRSANSLVEFAEFLGPVERRAKETGDSVHVVLESTTNSRAMQRLLVEYGREAGIDLTARVLDARKVRIIAESVTKCDRLDAAVLNELSRCNLKLPVCYMPDDEEFALREHLRARSDLVRMRTMLKNRIHALLHRRGILAPTGHLFTASGQAFLEQAALDEAGRTILQRYQETLDQLTDAVEASNRSLRELVRRPRWTKSMALLQTMPGIGRITGLTMLAELGNLHRFRSRAAVANYAGLTPVVRASNDKQYHGGITHRGSTHLRAVLTEAAWVAVPRVPAYRLLFERVEKKKHKATAIVAVARQMLEDAWTMLKKDEAFRYVSVPGGDTMAGSCPDMDTINETSRRGRSTASSVAG